MNLSRRTFGLGLIATLAAPAIIRTPGLLMPVRPAPRWARMVVSYDIVHEDFSEWLLRGNLVTEGLGLTDVHIDAALVQIHVLREQAGRRVVA